ncbi:MAG: hypothetical protein JWN04_3506 [Myxococcaceae bacterium]|nr:hypothetical protein [Myxococcaceae bacterium]
MIRCRLLIVALMSWCATANARADHYAGLKLAPTVHGGVANRVVFGGAGAELSFQKWLLVELMVSGQSAPVGDYGRAYHLPGAVQTALAVYSRAGGGTHTFVYGVGTSYSSRYECPSACSLFAALGGPEEHRAALDLISADVALGYEARLASGLFFRGINKLQVPVFMSDMTTRDASEGVTHLGKHYGGGWTEFSRLSIYLTVGYAFQLHR